MKNPFESIKAKISELMFRLSQKKHNEALSSAMDKVENPPKEKKPLFAFLKRKTKEPTPEKEKKPKDKRKEKKKKKEKRKAKLKFNLDMAGIKRDPQIVVRLMLIIAAFIDFFGFLYYILKTSSDPAFGLVYVLMVFFTFATLGYALSVFVSWIIFYVYIDVRIYQRRIEIEKVLPDFLQLASANMKSGMPIDRAMWLAVRPRFGVLAKEIETVAKQTMTGSDLEVALKGFSDKYDSMILKRAISLIIEGLKSGGEIGDLLNRISSDIQDSDILRKEMSASLTTYVIFISFATVMAAPFLFGLASQLLSIVQEVTSNIDMPSDAQGGIGISVGGSGIAHDDFQIFAMAMLAVTSLFSAMIIATIQKGDIKAGMKYIPIFIITTIVLFRISAWGLGLIFGGMF